MEIDSDHSMDISSGSDAQTPLEKCQFDGPTNGLAKQASQSPKQLPSKSQKGITSSTQTGWSMTCLEELAKQAFRSPEQQPARSTKGKHSSKRIARNDDRLKTSAREVFRSLEREPARNHKRDDLSQSMDLSSGRIEDLTHQYLPGSSNRISSEMRKGNDLSDGMDLSSGPDVEHDTNDHSSVSQRASTTPFNESAASSHTSAVLFNDVKGLEDSSGANGGALKPPSPSSDLSSILTPAPSLTPAILKPATLKISTEPIKSTIKGKISKPRKVDFSEQRPRFTVTTNTTRDAVAQQGMHAAMASRLKPFELHPQEYQLLRDHICHAHVTAYLNIRNRILRLWVRNPLVQVTQEEAISCVQSSRWTGLAKVAHEWLVRKGYINFGCLEIASPTGSKSRRGKAKRAKRKTIVVVGAGMAGLGCARQLEGLVRHYHERWTAAGEDPPHVVLLEGRNRIGGRLYSHPFKNQDASGIPPNRRCTAEMGAHIITGFDHGNPMNMIVRGQLALHHHVLSPITKIHDTNGELVDDKRDKMIEALFNDVLERAGQYRHRVPQPSTVQGDEQYIQLGRDPHQKGGPTIAQVELETPNVPEPPNNDETESVPAGIDKLTGKAHMVTGSRRKKRPAVVAEEIGWHLGSDVLSYDDLNLDAVAKDTLHPTLGAAMDEAVKQYQFLLDLTPQDMRLMNWHYANLEYANAAHVGKLSLGGWDQDTGNEFSGGHAQVIGGYQQVPRGLLQSPTKLDLRTRKIVKQIEYNVWSGNSKTPGARIRCEDGETFEADYVVLTSSLGVLKDQAIKFSPPLPDWKMGPIDRLGFGLLNKCILIYNEPFWDTDQDMFGLLREPDVKDSVEQEDYTAVRGRFYFFWNCLKTSGRPVLISLMAGDAAYSAEETSDAALVEEATHELRKIYKDKNVPLPEETIVTRWGQDRFSRGTYSYVGPESILGDYDTMAARVGNLYFAGEATCATHPATVHGAYISGLRAASEIIEDLLGPIEIPNPLVSWPANARPEPVPQETPSRRSSSQHQQPVVQEVKASPVSAQAHKAELEKLEAEIIEAIHSTLGFRPSLPKSSRSNAFLLFTSEHWAGVKAELEKKSIKYDQTRLRKEVGEQWRKLTNEEKQPWEQKVKDLKASISTEQLTYPARLRAWDDQAIEIRRRYIEEHPGVMTEEEQKEMWTMLEQYGDFESGERKAKRASGFADVKDGSLT